MYDIRFLFYSRWFTCLFGQHTPMLIWGSNCAAKAVLEVPEAAEQDESEKWALNAPRESESCLNRILAEVLMLGTLGNVCFSSLKIFVFHLYITWLEKLLATSVCLGVGSAPRTLKGGKIMLQLIWFRDNGAFLKVPPSAAGIKSSKKKIMLFPLCGFTQPGDAKVPWQPHEYPNPCNSKETCNNIQPGSSEASPLLLHAVNVVADGAPWLVHMWFLS